MLHGCYTEVGFLWNTLFALCILPAKQNLFGVDPTRLELVASAMRGHHEGLQRLSGACKTPANGSILKEALSSAFWEIYSDCCTTTKVNKPLNDPFNVELGPG